MADGGYPSSLVCEPGRVLMAYLAGSIAAFNVGSLQLFQVVFARGTDNNLPWSREHLYKT